MQSQSQSLASSSWGRVRHRADDDGQAPLRSVIVTLSDGGSYDPLFQQVPQRVPDGRVSVWKFGPEHFDVLAGALDAGARSDGELGRALDELRDEVSQVPDGASGR